ncbi:MAG: S46 family peptidase, partial [Ignavibacteriae bacterium]|nr:S46 family peptidase [Ignavibacteriota bacterium]
GENLEETGFYAESIDDERVVPNMYAEQLAYIVDVTDQINEAIDAVKTDDDKVDAKNTKSKELVEFYNNETGLKCQFVSLFNGGKYSIYGYKRYDDVRLVFLPEQAIASFGGDYDNFTYPRYDLDCAFFRVYDDAGKPVTSNNFFKFSENGVQKDDVIFSVGNPGSTNRLNTVSQLEYNRDISYRNRAFLLDQYYMLLDDLKTEYPDRANDFEKIRTRIGNGQKVFHYTELGLLDPYLIARKRDFENKIRAEVDADPELRDKYSNLWDSVRDLREELKPIDSKLAVYKPSRFFGSVYFSIAKDIIDHANQMKTSFGKDDPNSKKLNIDSLVNEIYPAEIDSVLEEAKLQVQLDYIRINLGNEDNLVKKLLGDLSGREAAEEVLAKSFLVNRQKVKQLLQKSPDEILNSDDPFIYFVSNTMNEIDALSKRSNEIKNTEDVLINMYGKVLFEIY